MQGKCNIEIFLSPGIQMCMLPYIQVFNIVVSIAETRIALTNTLDQGQSQNNKSKIPIKLLPYFLIFFIVTLQSACFVLTHIWI